MIWLLFLTVPYGDSIIKYNTTADKISFHYMRSGQRIAHLNNIDQSLKFAMNGAMYMAGTYAPVGLYVEKGRVIHHKVCVNDPSVNFGVNPQAVFYVDTNHRAGIVDAKKANVESYYYAVQIAPMLVMNGKINPAISGFNGKCKLRNGVGIKKDGSVVMLLAKCRTTFPEFAQLFIDAGCVTAAFIDGGISEAWTPAKDYYAREFGVMVGSR
jgi:uncharacterized protein YigE (DUF2233 family)